MKKRVWAKLIGLSVLVILLVILILQNRGPVQMKFLFFQSGKLPQSLLLAIVFLLGLVTGIIVTFLISSREKKR
jgi:uncharacterized integral membrane protein